MSSKFIPEKEFSNNNAIFLILFTSCVFKHNGIASTSPSSLNKTAFPSITGSPAVGPMFPKPKMALPSEIIATGFLKSITSLISVSITPPKALLSSTGSISSIFKDSGKMHPLEQVGINSSLS